jgi:pimeloyl-ACP methyl ester carboxylesterase
MSITMRRLIALAAAAAAGITFTRYRRELAEIRRQVKEGGRTADTAAGPIEYGVQGYGPPALIIHGAGGGYDQGLMLSEGFAGFQVIAPSRFGYLGTPTPPDISPAAQGDAHAALLDALGVSRAVVAGVSAGAPSAVELALRHPECVRALVLIVPRGYAPSQVTEVKAPHEGIMRVVMSGADLAYWAALHIARGKVVQFLGVPPDLEARASPTEHARVNKIMRTVLPLSMRIAGIRNDARGSLSAPCRLNESKHPPSSSRHGTTSSTRCPLRNIWPNRFPEPGWWCSTAAVT